MWCTYQGVDWEGAAAGVASVRRHQELLPPQTETVTAGFKLDPPLAKHEPLRDAGGISVTMCLRKGKTALH